MVRLKANAERRKVKAMTRFNSNMVRLKAPFICSGLIFLSRFNSNMVRLKADIAFSRNELMYSFQFQYGAIKGRLQR